MARTRSVHSEVPPAAQLRFVLNAIWSHNNGVDSVEDTKTPTADDPWVAASVSRVVKWSRPVVLAIVRPFFHDYIAHVEITFHMSSLLVAITLYAQRTFSASELVINAGTLPLGEAQWAGQSARGARVLRPIKPADPAAKLTPETERNSAVLDCCRPP